MRCVCASKLVAPRQTHLISFVRLLVVLLSGAGGTQVSHVC